MKLEKLRSYGYGFDEAVESAADAMAGIGYASRFASRKASAADGSLEDLRAAILQLGMLCLRIEGELGGLAHVQPTLGPDMQTDFLAVHAAAHRLVTVVRAAQESGVLVGRAAAEIDGDVDEVEEHLLQLRDPGQLVEAARSLASSAASFEDMLPNSVRLELASLKRALRSVSG